MDFDEHRLRHGIVRIDRKGKSLALGSQVLNECTPVVVFR
jgi:hypothetical protein